VDATDSRFAYFCKNGIEPMKPIHRQIENDAIATAYMAEVKANGTANPSAYKGGKKWQIFDLYLLQLKQKLFSSSNCY
jgi:hypothetical protein